MLPPICDGFFLKAHNILLSANILVGLLMSILSLSRGLRASRAKFMGLCAFAEGLVPSSLSLKVLESDTYVAGPLGFLFILVRKL